MKRVNRQLTLKPQDLLVVMKLHVLRSQPSYASLASALGLSASEVHSSLSRALMAKLVAASEKGGVPMPNPAALREFVTHGARYAFPPFLGPVTRGVATAFGADPLRSALTQADDAPVWPHAQGNSRGPALYPLYPTVPIAATNDRALYELLALFDGIRVGAARERNMAIRLIDERLV